MVLSKLGTKVRQLRLELGISQRQLAGSEMTRAYISMIEAGKVCPSLNKLQIIAQRLRQPLTVLLDGPVDPNNAVLVATLFRSADGLLEAERYENAIEVLEQALRLCTLTGSLAGKLHSLEKLGIALRKSESMERALDTFEKLVEEAKQASHAEKMARGLNHLGSTFYAMRDYLMAKRCYFRALQKIEGRKRLMDLSQEILINLGNCLIQLGTYEEATTTYQQALALHPYVGDQPKLAAAYLGLGCAHHLRGEPGEALRMAARSLELFEGLQDKQGTFASLYSIAIWEADCGAPERSLEKLRRCQEWCREEGLGNREALVLRDYAWCLFLTNDIPEAIQVCQEALALVNQQGDRELYNRICELRGQCYTILGDYERAVDQWSERPARPTWTGHQLMGSMLPTRARKPTATDAHPVPLSMADDATGPAIQRPS